MAKVKIKINVDYIGKEVRIQFSELTDNLGMDFETAIRFSKEIEKKAMELQGKLIFPVTQ